ncbi:MAG: long-chain-acyl-CoA synthetase, partial [Sphingomonadaceae bacterium]
GLGSTEANYGITNVDNKVGSVGRVPYPAHTNMKFVRFDVEADDHVRDAEGRLVEAKVGEVAELIAEVLGGTGVGGYFEGYTSREATEQKLLRDVVKPGDVWFRSGDLVRFDEEDYFYFVDRIGNTFRWKSENVSTEEVAAVLGGFPGPDIVNVYGVKVPGTEGRAGMVALTYADPTAFDAEGFYRFAAANLAHYAVPVFVRVSAQAEMTTTFKLRKVELQREGYSPDLVHGDPLFVADPAVGRYVPLTAEVLERLGIAPFNPES